MPQSSATKPPRLRERSRAEVSNDPVGFQQYRIWTNCSEPSWVPNSALIKFNVGSYEWMQDTVTPDFDRKRRKGIMTFTSMKKEKWTGTNLGGYGGRLRTLAYGCSPNYSYRDNRGNLMATLLPLAALRNGDVVPEWKYVFTDAEISRMVDVVASSVRAKRNMPEANLVESLAEFHKTVDLVGNPLKKLESLLTKMYSKHHTLLDIAGGGLKHRGKLLTEIPGLWLMYRYGVKPLLNDIAFILAESGKPNSDSGKSLQTTRSKYSQEKSITDSLVRSYGVTELTIQRISSDDVRIRGGCLDLVEAPTLLYKYGISLKGMMGLPWELTQYSHVADWFANIGDYLYASMPLIGVENKGTWLTVERSCMTTYNVLSGRSNPSTTYTMDVQPHGSYVSSMYRKYRIPLPQPALRVRPSFGMDKVTRVADAAATSSILLEKLFRALILKGR